ncbi:MAG: ATP-binding cassette domain-containing protein, partial [Rhodospirillales bacterium]|nr:ATP-binding cassette domain-containing protein [Rhodospirillales bacterium]
FEGVHFRWQPNRPPVFDGLTLDVPQGARVALIGPSGVGKSSLAALALKVVAPQSGRVLLGGVDLASLAATDIRGRMAWLSQTTHLFDDTIRANLLLGRPEADEAALWAALEGARIADLVRALPDGLDTWVGEGGVRFSGGQGRRLALARTLLSPAPILILDEPCAGLDAETERDFFQTLNETAEGRTLILIAHRLTGAERVDRIWRLSGGHAVAAAG